MRIKVGIMGSADDTLPEGALEKLRERGTTLGVAIAKRGCMVLTGATTGLPQLIGGAAHDSGALHVGISPAADHKEHTERYRLHLTSMDAIIYTGFGLKGRNVVLVRSCDIALFIGGSIGSLNELTIALDEGRIIGCLKGSGGVADEAERLIAAFPKKAHEEVFYDEDPVALLDLCLDEYNHRGTETQR